MKRSTALLIFGSMLAAGWLTGTWLANRRAPREAAAPNVREIARQKSSASAEAGAMASRSRNFAAELATVEGIPDRKKRLGQLTLLCIDWAKVDPQAALQALLDASAADKDPDRTPFYSAFSYFFESWARTHGWDAAFAAAKGLEDSGARQFALRQLGHEALQKCERPAERLTELLAAAPECDRTAMLSSAMRMWGLRPGADPAEITAWIDALPRDAMPADQLTQLERAAASACMAKNPRQAADWLLSRATKENRSEHLRNLVQEWAVMAPNACGEWLRKQPFGPDMDPAIEFFSQIIVRDDGESAVQWASRTSDPARRERLLQIVREKWSVVDPAAAAAAANRMLPAEPAPTGVPKSEE